jgi:hypothetical protein
MNISKLFGVSPPEVVKYKTEVACVNPGLVIGYELETENLRTRGSCTAFNFEAKADGSLRGASAEYISKPMASTHALAAVGDFLKYNGYDATNYSDRCSIHVHANCTDLTREQVMALALVYTTMEEVLFSYVGHDRDSNIYCIPWSQCRMQQGLAENFLNGGSLSNWNKYTALNLLPLKAFGTVEFRQMYGTADMNVITTWTNLIGALFNVATTTPLKDLIQLIKELNNNSQYEVYFARATGNQLPYNEQYRAALEDGIIMAKYALIGFDSDTYFDPKKKVDKTIKKAEKYRAFYDEGAPLLDDRGIDALLQAVQARQLQNAAAPVRRPRPAAGQEGVAAIAERALQFVHPMDVNGLVGERIVDVWDEEPDQNV